MIYFPNTVKNAYYVEWLDSVGIYIDIDVCDFKNNTNMFDFGINNVCYGWEYETRQEATQAAIIEANNIYNESNV